MIKKIEIQNYRSCIKTIFRPQEDLSVVIGPNGCGKTNILKAFLLLKKLTRADLPRFSKSEEKSSGKSKLKVCFEYNRKPISLNTIINSNTDESNDDVILSSRQNWSFKEFTGDSRKWKISLSSFKFLLSDQSFHIRHRQAHLFRLHSYFNFNADDYKALQSVSKPLLAIFNFLSDMKYYSASQFTNPSDCPVSFEIEKEGEERRGIRLRGHTKFLFDLFTAFKSPESSGYQKFFEIIGPKGIGLVDKINFKEFLTSTVRYTVKSGGSVREEKLEKMIIIPQFTIGKQELSPNQLSEGTFKTVALLFYIMTENSSIFLIEEPEVCVHHGLLLSIIDLIKDYSNKKQIIISTHSDFILDRVESKNVYKVSKTTEGSQINNIHKTMSAKELSALREYLNNEGNLGEYWKHGALE